MMQKYQDVVTIIGPPGLIPIVGAQITVYVHGTTNLAVIYSDNGVSVASNPTTSDSSGRYSFYAADGRYDLSISGNALQTTLLTDILLQDGGTSITTAAVGDGVTDNSVVIQAELNDLIAAGGGTLFFPQGKYIVNSRIKIQNTVYSIQLVGEGRGNPYVSWTLTTGSLLVGQTGGILIDAAGNNGLSLIDIGLFSGTTNPSTIGVLLQRTAVEGFCQFFQMVRASISMATAPTANGNVGSIGIMNKRGEHHGHTDSWVMADRPIIYDGSSFYSAIVSPDYAESFPVGATLAQNDHRNCGFVSFSGHTIELISTYHQRFTDGYVLIKNTKSGVALRTFNAGMSFVDVIAETNSGEVPACWLQMISNAEELTMRVNSPISGLTGILSTTGAVLFGGDLRFIGSFGSTFSFTAGGDARGVDIWYKSSDGHSVTTTGVYGRIFEVSSGQTRIQANTLSFYNVSTGATQQNVSTVITTTGVSSAGFGYSSAAMAQSLVNDVALIQQALKNLGLSV